jgi:hypothetical protein
MPSSINVIPLFSFSSEALYPQSSLIEAFYLQKLLEKPSYIFAFCNLSQSCLSLCIIVSFHIFETSIYLLNYLKLFLYNCYRLLGWFYYCLLLQYSLIFTCCICLCFHYLHYMLCFRLFGIRAIKTDIVEAN